MKNYINKFFSSYIVGFAFIFASVNFLGRTESFSWEMWVQIFLIVLGGIILIKYGQNVKEDDKI